MGDSIQMMLAALRVCAVPVLSAMGLPVLAASVPEASTFVQCSVAGNNFTGPTACEFGGFPGVPPSAAAQANLMPVPSAFARATAPANAVLGAGAGSTILYWFQVEGPDLGVPIPLLMDFHLLAESTSESAALARIIAHTSLVPFAISEQVCSDGSCDETQLDETVSLTVLTGSGQNSVTLYAQAQAFVTGASNETAFAVADPYFYVDPAFPNAELYHVVMSAGVGNAPPVPEPATLCLLGPGLLWLRWRVAGGRAGG